MNVLLMLHRASQCCDIRWRYRRYFTAPVCRPLLLLSLPFPVLESSVRRISGSPGFRRAIMRWRAFFVCSRVPGTRTRWNGWNLARCRRWPVRSMRRRVDTMVWRTALGVAERPHKVTRPPSTVVGAVEFVVVQPEAHIVIVPIISNSTAWRQDGEQPDYECER
jgi:hypothetical protein